MFKFPNLRARDIPIRVISKSYQSIYTYTLTFTMPNKSLPKADKPESPPSLSEVLNMQKLSKIEVVARDESLQHVFKEGDW